MNFARHQAQADRTARRLVWLHALASLAVVIGINAAAALIWQLLFGAAPYPKGFFLTNTLVVSGLIVGGAWIETARLRDDGALIARRLCCTRPAHCHRWNAAFPQLPSPCATRPCVIRRRRNRTSRQ
jgi:hypothetical protein